MTVKKKPVVTNRVLQDIRLLIEKTRSTVAAAVNVGLTMLYWQIGKRISAEILKGARAKYGEEIVATLSQELIKDNQTRVEPGILQKDFRQWARQ